MVDGADGVDGMVLLAEGREAEVFLRGDGRVVKLQREASGRAGERVRREALALGILDGAGIDAPAVIDEVVVDGRPGLVLERVEGDDLLTRLGRQPQAVFRGGRVMGQVHAAMHETVAPAVLPDVRDPLRRRIERDSPLPGDLRTAALAVLDGLPEGDRLCHGDLHLANLLGEWAAPVVIDWGDAARGDPLADHARTALLHQVGVVPPGAPRAVRVLAPLGRRTLRSRYVAAYRRQRGYYGHGPVDADLFDRWTFVNAAARFAAEIPAEHTQLLAALRGRASVASAP